jgi:MraZ protein
MSAFSGNFSNKLDAKGRVSIPADFRSVLAPPGSKARIVLRPSPLHPCLEGCTEAHFQALTDRLDTMDPFSAEYDDLATELHGQTIKLDLDDDGRTVLPLSLIAEYGFSGTVKFIGLGRTFQIWEQAAGDQRLADLNAARRARALTRSSGAA